MCRKNRSDCIGLIRKHSERVGENVMEGGPGFFTRLGLDVILRKEASRRCGFPY
jgi:hypothetical protein